MKNTSKLKLNILNEKLYITGMVNQLYEDIASYNDGNADPKVLIESILTEDKKKSIIGDIVDEFKLAPKILFTFGTGIGAFVNPVTKLLEGSGLQVSEYEVYLLIITAITILLNESNVSGLVKKLKELDLDDILKDVKDYISNTEKLINTVTKKVLGVTYSLADILAFTSLLVPTMNLLSNIITEYGLTSKTVNVMLKGIILSTSVYAIKSVIKRIRGRI
jgi:hypothetical protein